MPNDPSDEFTKIAKAVSETGKPRQMTVRNLLGYFGQERRGRHVAGFISKRLRKLDVITEPNFDEVHIDASVKIMPRPQPVAKAPPVSQRPDRKLVESFPADETTETKLPTVETPPVQREEERSPYLTVGLLASANRKPHRVRGNEELKQAVTLMLMHDISHVPVMQSERVVEGIITWRSIGRAKAANKPCAKSSDCMDTTVRVLALGASLFDAVREIVRHGVVLVHAQDKSICGLVTAKDIAEQFVALSEPFLFLEQIENHLRSLLQKARLTTDELRDLVDPADANRKQRTKTVDDLTFGEYLRGLGTATLWDRLKLEIDRGLFVQRLDSIRQIRNSVMHFHPDGISAEERDVLAKTREMLQSL